MGKGRTPSGSKIAVSDATEILAAWEESSRYWRKHQASIEQLFAPLTTALIDAAQIRRGEHVLDIGGGAGQPSLSIASMVGDEGSITYTDPSAGMVETARDTARQRGLTNIHFQKAPADELPFDNDTFDVAVGRLSIMFFPDVAAGLNEIVRVVKPGGRVSFLVWSSKDANPFFSSINEVLDRFIPPEPEDDDAPGAFRFARPGKLSKLLADAGLTQIEERPLPFQIAGTVKPEEFWGLRSEMSDSLRAKLAKLTANQKAAVKQAVDAAVAEYFTTGEMSFPAQTLIVSGKVT
jgi:ubiquinone/menaquinone biosynthesis C-methylase UbiE